VTTRDPGASVLAPDAGENPDVAAVDDVAAVAHDAHPDDDRVGVSPSPPGTAGSPTPSRARTYRRRMCSAAADRHQELERNPY
jgi:hypothetical protein